MSTTRQIPDGSAQFTGVNTRSAPRKTQVYRRSILRPRAARRRWTIAHRSTAATERPLRSLRRKHSSSAPRATCMKPALVPASVFQLTQSQVGDDASNNNLFENIDTATLGAYAEPTPTPEPTRNPPRNPRRSRRQPRRLSRLEQQQPTDDASRRARHACNTRRVSAGAHRYIGVEQSSR